MYTTLAQQVSMIDMWAACSLVHALLDEVGLHTLDDGVDDASVDGGDGGVLHRSSDRLQAFSGLDRPKCWSRLSTCEVCSARCQGEQNGWLANLSSKEVRQPPHRFYSHV